MFSPYKFFSFLFYFHFVMFWNLWIPLCNLGKGISKINNIFFPLFYSGTWNNKNSDSKMHKNIEIMDNITLDDHKKDHENNLKVLIEHFE